MPLIPEANAGHTYLTLSELEVIAWEFREHGVSILAAGDLWFLDVPIAGKVTRFRAHRTAVVA